MDEQAPEQPAGVPQPSLWRSFTGYFKARPWLLIWLGIFAAGILILALAGQIHLQGDGYPTWYEWSVIVQVAAIWLIARFIFKVDLTEEYLLGVIFGIQWEFLTEPYWTYLPDKFNVLAWRDVPIMALVGWSTNFTIALLFSNWLGRKFFKLSPEQLMFDWRVLICDAIAIQIFGTAAEWTYGILFHCWDYNMDFGLGKSPVGLGWEVHIGYLIVFFWYGTTLRVWKRKLEGGL